MRRVDDELRAAYRSLAESEGDQPGHDYDRGYLTGWYDEQRHITRRRPDGGFRDAERKAEFRLGYRHGRQDGKGRGVDWWPDVALGDGSRGSGAAGVVAAIERARTRAAYSEKTAQPAAPAADAVSGAV